MRKTNTNGLPRGAGSMQIRHGVYWVTYRDADGAAIQENAHSKHPAIARILLAERTIEREEQFIAQMRAVISENTAALARAGYRLDAGRFARTGHGRGKGGVGRGAQAAARTGAEAKA